MPPVPGGAAGTLLKGADHSPKVDLTGISVPRGVADMAPLLRGWQAQQTVNLFDQAVRRERGDRPVALVGVRPTRAHGVGG